jgi:predicted RNA-binding Zn-ribbon protein involved in translation (DUF1610 family)
MSGSVNREPPAPLYTPFRCPVCGKKHLRAAERTRSAIAAGRRYYKQVNCKEIFAFSDEGWKMEVWRAEWINWPPGR